MTDHPFSLLACTDPEPPEGSILVIESTTGTAVQRFYSDGKYHATTGKVYDAFADLFRSAGGGRRRVYLLFAPKEA